VNATGIETTESSTVEASVIAFDIAPVAPYRLDLTVWALRRDPKNKLDRWDGTTYRRVVALDGKLAELSVRQHGTPDDPLLAVEVSATKPWPALQMGVTKALSRLLGTDINLSGFYRFIGAHNELRELAERFTGVKPPRFPTYVEALSNGILFQQISLPAGFTLLNNLVEALGPGMPGRSEHAFPLPERISALTPKDLRPFGISRQKGTALTELASVITGGLNLEQIDNMKDEDALAFLCQLRGVGRWTAQYFRLRGLGRLHVFPGDDIGARNKLKNWLGLERMRDYEAMQKISSGWYPYAGMIYFHLLLNHLGEKGCVNG
jgi:DNA-3-methyladenine glycosylase II